MLNGRGNILFTNIKEFYLMGCKDSRKWSKDRLISLSSSCTGIHNMQFNRQAPKLKKKPAASYVEDESSRFLQNPVTRLSNKMPHPTGSQ
jgi:hypothetical protein